MITAKGPMTKWFQKRKVAEHQPNNVQLQERMVFVWWSNAELIY